MDKKNTPKKESKKDVPVMTEIEETKSTEEPQLEFKVLCPIKHDGKTYNPGETISLNLVSATTLLEMKTIKRED